ncbi:MAG: class I tRNA ligase family protein, partial [Alphaproteobacteria bacterium]
MTQEYKPYAKTIANPNFADLEIQIIEKWKAENTFEKSVRGEGEFVFYDGPPFANGLPHYGHLLTGFIKDLFARFQTMLGNKVERRFGWDCHGLPAEMAAEKDLNLSGKVDIE